jgi:hypothetical protein
MKLTSMDRIFSKILRDLPITDIDEVSVIEWTGEALEFINAIRAKEEAVAFLYVNNYQCEIPYNLHNIIQIAVNTQVSDSTTTATASTDDEVLAPETDYPVCLDSCGTPYNDYSVAYYRPYYDLQYEYNLWRETSTYQRCYEPVRLTNHSFFNSIVCSENGGDCGNTSALYHNTQYEYTIIEGKILRFNFESGLIALAYLRNPLDSEGLPMIPDDISFTNAIVAYIILKIMKREFYSGKEGSSNKMQVAEQDWQWYCKQASNKSLIPKGIDELQNLVEQTNYLIPRRNSYHNYFGNLNNREVKNILHTELRNNAYYGRERTK